jgi:hypothetical protein
MAASIEFKGFIDAEFSRSIPASSNIKIDHFHRGLALQDGHTNI